MKIKFANVGGINTRYMCEGDGPTLVLIHGIGHSADVFYRNVDTLARDYFVIAPDLPGHGFTERMDLAGGAPQPSSFASSNSFSMNWGSVRTVSWARRSVVCSPV